MQFCTTLCLSLKLIKLQVATSVIVELLVTTPYFGVLVIYSPNALSSPSYAKKISVPRGFLLWACSLLPPVEYLLTYLRNLRYKATSVRYVALYISTKLSSRPQSFMTNGVRGTGTIHPLN